MSTSWLEEEQARAKEASRKEVRVLRNLCYQGVDYGPDCPRDTVTVDGEWAQRWIANGSAVLVAPDTQAKPEPPVVSIRIKLLRNTCIDAVDYGPDYDVAEVEIDAEWARDLIRRGRAVALAPDKGTSRAVKP